MNLAKNSDPRQDLILKRKRGQKERKISEKLTSYEAVIWRKKLEPLPTK